MDTGRKKVINKTKGIKMTTEKKQEALSMNKRGWMTFPATEHKNEWRIRRLDPVLGWETVSCYDNPVDAKVDCKEYRISEPSSTYAVQRVLLKDGDAK